MTKKDGGPAFPSMGMERAYQGPQVGTEDIFIQHRGMSLRNLYAGQALTGVLSNPDVAREIARSLKSGSALRSHLAETCFLIADAMVAESEKERPE